MSREWGDDRIARAFAAAFDGSPPRDLPTTVLSAVRRRPARGGTRRAWVAGMAAALVVVVGGIAIVASRPPAGPEPPATSAAVGTPPATPTPTARPSVAPPTTAPTAVPVDADGFPVEVVGLPVISVSEANALRDAGPDETEIAVRGWLYYDSFDLCVAYPEPPPPVERRCGDVEWLTEGLEDLIGDDGGVQAAQGPALRPLFRWGVPHVAGVYSLRDDATAHFGEYLQPERVVLAGHFDDHRSSLCEDVEACRRQFVVDALVWIEGEVAGLETPIHQDYPRPVLTREAVVSIASGPNASPMTVWAAVVDSTRAREIDPRFENPPSLLWLVRILAEEGGRPITRTHFVDDATGELYESAAEGIVRILTDG